MNKKGSTTTDEYKKMTEVLETFKNMLYNTHTCFYQLSGHGYNQQQIEDEIKTHFDPIKEIISSLEFTVRDRKRRFELWQTEKPQPTCRTGNCN